MRADRTVVAEMLDAAQLILDYFEGMTEAEFRADTRTQDAVVRRVVVLGEGARLVSEGLKAQHPEVPWRTLTGMRNVVAHQYWFVNLSILWNDLPRDLPPLMAALEQILPGLPPVEESS